MGDLINVGCCFGLATIIVGIRRINAKKKITEKVKRDDIHIGELAKLWERGQDAGQIHIKDIAPIWKKDIAYPLKQVGREPFENQDIEIFYVNYIEDSSWFDNSINHKEVCCSLLKLLDQEGDCPSVVNVSNDTEASWDSTTFSLLSTVTLTDHTIRVAEKTVELLEEKQLYFVIPDAIVTALGHDIGKLPSNKSNMYSLGEHPLAAGKVLSGIKIFKNLAKKNDIIKAIKMHHRQGNGLLGKIIREADQKARQQELDFAVENVKVEEPGQEQASKNDSKTESTTEKKQPVLVGGSAIKVDEDIYGIKPDKRRGAATKINISNWFDYPQFIEELKPSINKIENRVFTAFSMSDGYVYIQPKNIETVAKKIATDAGQLDIPQLDYKNKTMQKIMIAIVDYCRAQNVIAENLINPGYFGGYFTITTIKGKTFKGFYTPFLAETFGLIGELEANKKGMLKNFASVKIESK